MQYHLAELFVFLLSYSLYHQSRNPRYNHSPNCPPPHHVACLCNSLYTRVYKLSYLEMLENVIDTKYAALGSFVKAFSMLFPFQMNEIFPNEQRSADQRFGHKMNRYLKHVHNNTSHSANPIQTSK